MFINAADVATTRTSVVDDLLRRRDAEAKKLLDAFKQEATVPALCRECVLSVYFYPFVRVSEP
jgi:hypothetical protein